MIPLTDQTQQDPLRVLLERHCGGDRDAFAQLMKTLSDPIYGYLTRSGVSAAERDDLFQDIFCKVHEGAHRKMPEGPVMPWVLRITVNTVRDHHRRQKVRSIVALDADAGSDVTSKSVPADGALEAKETAVFLEEQMQMLPPAQREALLLSSVAGLGIKGAAEVLGEPPATIKTRVRRARVSLAEAIARRTKGATREQGR